MFTVIVLLLPISTWRDTKTLQIGTASCSNPWLLSTALNSSPPARRDCRALLPRALFSLPSINTHWAC